MLARCYCAVEGSVMAALRTMKKEEKGITAIEYAALAVGLAGLIIVLTGENGEISKAIKSAFENVTKKLSSG